jgi:nucleotide-binding universal stress UspA family protein
MSVGSVLAAADASEEGRAAILAAARVGQRCGASVTVLTVADRSEGDVAPRRVLQQLRETTIALLATLTPPLPPLEYAVESGIPGIEIPRFAENIHADLLVVGRKRRSSVQRLMMGDTADSVARRSRVPCLFVRAGNNTFNRLLVGLDGSERGSAVLQMALEFARELSARLRAVIVEPVFDSEQGAPWVQTGRSRRLAESIEALRRTTDQAAWKTIAGEEGQALVVHRGRVVDEILREIRVSDADVLVLGCHRGGPAGTIEGGSISRRLMHLSTCAVLTVPL